MKRRTIQVIAQVVSRTRSSTRRASSYEGAGGGQWS